MPVLTKNGRIPALIIGATMQTNELVREVALRTGLTEKKVAAIYYELVNVVHQAIEKGEDVAMAGLCRVKVRQVAPDRKRVDISPVGVLVKTAQNKGRLHGIG